MISSGRHLLLTLLLLAAANTGLPIFAAAAGNSSLTPAAATGSPCGLLTCNCDTIVNYVACGSLMDNQGELCVSVSPNGMLTTSVTVTNADNSFIPGTVFKWGYFMGVSRFSQLQTANITCDAEAFNRTAPCHVTCSFNPGGLPYSATVSQPSTSDRVSTVFPPDMLSAQLSTPIKDISLDSGDLCQENTDSYVQTYMVLHILVPQVRGCTCHAIICGLGLTYSGFLDVDG